MTPLLLCALLATTDAGPTPDAGPKPLGELTIDELLDCTVDATECQASTWDLAWELRRRDTSTQTLRERLRRERKEGPRREMLIFALYLSRRDPEVSKVMRRLYHDPDEEVAYYALNYGAKGCEPEALRILSAEPFESRADCQQWATTVALFGECKYRAATPFLVDSLRYACLNVVFAANESLRALYPEAPFPFRSPSAEAAYFRAKMNKPQ
jgi:hypothetical protein